MDAPTSFIFNTNFLRYAKSDVCCTLRVRLCLVWHVRRGMAEADVIPTRDPEVGLGRQTSGLARKPCSRTEEPASVGVPWGREPVLARGDTGKGDEMPPTEGRSR